MGQARRKAEPAKAEKVSIDTTYRQVREAFDALRGLAVGQIVDGSGPVSARLGFATILKAKRLLGALRPLVEQSNELLRELQAKHGWTEEQGFGEDREAARAFEKDVDEVLKTTVLVECERLGEVDFAGVGSVSSVLIGVLDALGPFWAE